MTSKPLLSHKELKEAVKWVWYDFGTYGHEYAHLRGKLTTGTVTKFGEERLLTKLDIMIINTGMTQTEQYLMKSLMEIKRLKAVINKLKTKQKTLKDALKES